MKTLLALATTCSLVSTVFAKGNAPANLPKEVQPMYCLVGDWAAPDGVMMIGGKKLKVDLKISCAPTAAGLGILCHAKLDIEGLGLIEETDLFGYDPGQNRYHWFSVTARGDTHDHVALPPGPKDSAITFVYNGKQDGKPLKETITLGLSADGNKIEFRNEGLVGGKQAWLGTATMIKK